MYTELLMGKHLQKRTFRKVEEGEKTILGKWVEEVRVRSDSESRQMASFVVSHMNLCVRL
jgi:hypothetical protein